MVQNRNEEGISSTVLCLWCVAGGFSGEYVFVLKLLTASPVGSKGGLFYESKKMSCS